MNNLVGYIDHKLSLRTLFACVLVVLLSFGLSSHSQAQYVKASGTKIVDENGAELYFHGMNLGNWLLWEGYLMMGDFKFKTHTQFLNNLTTVFGDAAKAKEFEKQWRLNYVTEQTIVDLKKLGYNSVRVPFHHNMFWQNGAVSNAGFVYIDNLVRWCRTQNMHILLDMHAAPGYQNPGDHSDNINSNSNQPRDSVKFWDGNNVSIASQIWAHIANYYKNEPVIWGYDLVNEPVLQAGREYELAASMVAIRNAIRQVDNNHIIVVEGHWWASQLQFLDWTDATTQSKTNIRARWDNNLVLETHHYVFGNAGGIAELYLRDDITNRMGVPLILGEYGEDTTANLRTMKDWSTANIAGDFPWSFKKVFHDKTLWTVPQNDVYKSVVAAINAGTSLPSSYNGMISFAQNNIANGKPGLVYHQDFYDGTKPACSTKAPGNLTGTASSPQNVKLTWTDNATGEDGYSVSRDGNLLQNLAANSTVFNDTGLIGETCYNYTVTTVSACSSNSTVKVCTPCGGNRSPYTGQAFAVPGVIEAESFDIGCQGLTFSDTTGGNSGGAYRTSDVDISTTVDNGQSGYNIGWVDTNEWLEYSVNVKTAGKYNLSYRVATPQTTGQIQFMVGGSVLSTTTIPSTGDWSAWATVNSSPVTLAAGPQIVRINFSGKEVNLNNFTLSVATATSSVAPSSKSSSKASSSTGTTGPIQSGATYAIISKNSGKAVDVSGNSTSNGAQVHQWTFFGNANQLWIATQLSGNTYKLISKNSGKSLDVKDVSTNNGADIQQWDYQGNPNQRWIITALGNGYYKVISENSGKALDVRDVSTNDGAAIQQWDYNGGANQQWQFQLK
jgi:endoglucanase